MTNAFLRRFQTLVPAAFAALALSACVDDSVPVVPITQGKTPGPVLDAPRDWPNGDIGTWPARDRLDTSRRFFHRAEAFYESTYAYTRLEDGNRFTQLFFAPDDTTRVSFLHGVAVERAAVYTGDVTPPYPEGQLHTLPLILGPVRYFEQGAQVGTHADGAPPLTLDSLYGLCQAMLPAAADTGFVLELDGEGFLRECGPMDCRGEDCPERIVLSKIEMKRLPGAPEAGYGHPLTVPGFHGDHYIVVDR